MPTIKTAIGGVSGDLLSLNILISVWNDDLTALDYEDALTAALAVAPATLYGLYPEGTPTVQEEAQGIFKFQINYTPLEVTNREPPPPPEMGSLVRRPNFQAKPKTLKNFLEPIGVFDASGNVTGKYPKTKWLIDLSGEGYQYYQEARGAEFQPAAENNSLDLYLPNASISSGYFDDVLELVSRGCFNAGNFFGKPPGSVQIVRFSASERNENDWELSFGFGYVPPQAGLAVNDQITIPLVRGCDYYWLKTKTTFDDVNRIMTDEASLAIVGRVWDLDDFSVLGLPGS